jgi:dihydroorotate dehydrogenase electron transfer subunit
VTAAGTVHEEVAGIAAPARINATVVVVRPFGAYTRVVLAGDPLGEALPGQFVAVAPGGPDGALVAARAFGVHDADPVSGTVSLVVASVGPGSRWLASRSPGDRVPVTGPLGVPFSLPGAGGAWVGVGGGYGSAAMAWAARTVVARGGAARVVAGAATAEVLCDLAGLSRVLRDRLHATTDDGSAGTRGTVLAVLPGVLDRAVDEGPEVSLAACGPMPMLAAVAAHVAGRPDEGRIHAEVSVEERMACGIGICMTCVLPVRAADGVTRMVRACTDGPTLPAGAVRWDAIVRGGSRVPADTVGAPR